MDPGWRSSLVSYHNQPQKQTMNNSTSHLPPTTRAGVGGNSQFNLLKPCFLDIKRLALLIPFRNVRTGLGRFLPTGRSGARLTRDHCRDVDRSGGFEGGGE